MKPITERNKIQEITLQMLNLSMGLDLTQPPNKTLKKNLERLTVAKNWFGNSLITTLILNENVDFKLAENP